MKYLNTKRFLHHLLKHVEDENCKLHKKKLQTDNLKIYNNSFNMFYKNYMNEPFILAQLKSFK